MNHQTSNSKDVPYLSTKSILKGRWVIMEKIGNGGFGEIYKAKDLETKKMVAVKVESCVSNKQVLKIEAVILKRLQDLPHTCELYGCGRTDKVNFIVMTLLGQNLSDLRKKQAKQAFSISTVLRLAVQVITAVQEMHNCGFLHRDIKPSNFAMGIGEESRKCILIDFGLARQYTMPTGELKQPRPIAGFRGTVRYASINAHLGNELGRHDDLWSVFYMLIELATGNLPWRKIREKEEAGKAKQECDHNNLINGLPEEFEIFMNHLRKLTYHDKPDYQYLINLFECAQLKLGISQSDPFDWESDFVALPSVTSASGLSQQVVSPADHQNTPEQVDSLNKAGKENKSIGEKVKKICKVFQTMNSPKSSHPTTGSVAGGNRKSSPNSPPRMSIDNKTKQSPYITTAESTSNSKKNNNVSNSSSNRMQVAVAVNEASTNCEKVNSKHPHHYCPVSIPVNEEVVSEDVPVVPYEDNDGMVPRKGFLPSLHSDSEDRSHSCTRSAEIVGNIRSRQFNSGFVTTGEMLKDVSISSSTDDGQPYLKKKFERVDSPLLHRINVGTTLTEGGSTGGRSCLVATLDAPVEKNELFTSSLNILPRPPIDPPRTGYFCSSARKRKFVKLSKRILANSLRQEQNY